MDRIQVEMCSLPACWKQHIHSSKVSADHVANAQQTDRGNRTNCTHASMRQTTQPLKRQTQKSNLLPTHSPPSRDQERNIKQTNLRKRNVDILDWKRRKMHTNTTLHQSENGRNQFYGADTRHASIGKTFACLRSSPSCGQLILERNTKHEKLWKALVTITPQPDGIMCDLARVYATVVWKRTISAKMITVVNVNQYKNIKFA